MKSVWIRLSGDTFMVTLCLIPQLNQSDQIYQEYTSSKDIWICRICRGGTRFMVPENSRLLFVVQVLLFVICYLDILVTTEALKKWLCQQPADGFPDAKKETERDVKNFSCGGRCSNLKTCSKFSWWQWEAQILFKGRVRTQFLALAVLLTLFFFFFPRKVTLLHKHV